MKAAQYLVCVSNRRVQCAARMTIEFESYALVHIPGAWKPLARSQRFPLAYLETSELFGRLQLNPDELTWQQLFSNPAPHQVPETAATCSASASAPEGEGASFTDAIAEAKRKLADSLGIASERIEIRIRL